MVAYLLQVSLCWLIFYLLYYVWLSKETFFNMNRWYLLSTLVLGLLIPLLPSPFSTTVQENDWVTVYVAGFNQGLEMLEVTVTAPAVVENSFDWYALLKFIYWGGVAFTGFRFLSGLWRIGSMYWKAEHIRIGDFRVALTNEAHLPFSFFRVIFKSKLGSFNAFEEEKITDHELAHVRGWHTIDVLLVELAGIFLWCSPPIYLYRRSLRMVHEYIADSAAIRTGQKKQYGHLLIRQSQSGLQLALANHFIQSQLKKRIIMMTKTRSRRQAFLKYLPVIPILVVALVVFSNWEAVASDPIDFLNSDPIAAVEATDLQTTSSDFDPKELMKEMRALLAKTKNLEANEANNKLELALLSKFALLHEKWSNKYPEHQKEIQAVAQKVAEENMVFLKFGEGKIQDIYDRFGALKYSRKQGQMSPSPEKSDVIKLKPEGSPYVLINEEPAPADWKSQLDPESIESVDVLKGEAALNLYGEKAKDGAIRIYTKDYVLSGSKKELPRFPGCEELTDGEERAKCAQRNLLEYVMANIRYPEDYKKYNVQGTVVASYVVDKEGQIKDVRILRSIGAGFDREVERVLTGMPTQIPGRVDGQPAEIEMKLPIKFKATQEDVAENPGLPTPQVIISKIQAGESSPLYVLDGEVVTEKAVQALNPEDIEKIDVLKDKQAVTEYGNNAVDGVVRIFTKGRQYDVAPVFKSCTEVEKTAQDACSKRSFLESIYKNIRYPASARQAGVQGMVVVKYTIGKDGKLEDTYVVRGIDEAVDKEVLRVIRELPDWKPAQKDGQPVAVDMVLPVQFRLEGADGTSRVKDAASKQPEAREVKGKLVDEVVVVGYGNSTPAKEKEIFKLVEEMPRFPGCEDAGLGEKERKACADKSLVEYVYKQINYPAVARKNGVEGMVVVGFVVNTDGTISNAKVLRDIGAGCGDEALRVVNSMNKNGIRWIPGNHEGKTVPVQFNLPVRFKLGSGEAKTPDLEERVVTGYGKEGQPKEIFKVVEEMPRFPGCEGAGLGADEKKACADKNMLEYLYQQLQYPEIARKNDVEGMVVVGFVINTDGTVSDAKVLRDIGANCGDEALRVINTMNEKGIRWVPGRQGGKAVAVQFNLPVRFKLGDEGLKKEPTTIRVDGPNTTPALNNLELHNFKAAPNPTKGQINLRFQAEPAPVNIRIMSANGQVIYQQQLPQFNGSFDEQIDLSDAPKGTLYLSIQQGEKLHSSTIVLQ
ncbi:MAG: TonB family protein [Saprospiraceae bacterium]|nr:TonB family protein [Lewinella sp.]